MDDKKKSRMEDITKQIALNLTIDKIGYEKLLEAYQEASKTVKEWCPEYEGKCAAEDGYFIFCPKLNQRMEIIRSSKLMLN
jgi:hypothetical protein